RLMPSALSTTAGRGPTVESWTTSSTRSSRSSSERKPPTPEARPLHVLIVSRPAWRSGNPSGFRPRDFRGIGAGSDPWTRRRSADFYPLTCTFDCGRDRRRSDDLALFRRALCRLSYPAENGEGWVG